MLCGGSLRVVAARTARRICAFPLSRQRLCTSQQFAAVHSPLETPSDVHPPFARYTHACLVPPDSHLIFTSGQLGITSAGSIPEGAEAQTALALKNIAQILASSGAGLENIVRLNAYVSGREHLAGCGSDLACTSTAVRLKSSTMFSQHVQCCMQVHARA